MEELTASGVRAVCLLALSDGGVPSHDEGLARRFAEVKVPSFGCTPRMLPALLEGALKGHDLFQLAHACGVKPQTKSSQSS